MLEALPADDVRQGWITPDALYAGLHAEFDFNLDVASDVDNAKCLNFFSRTVDGLARPWDGHRVWCNPPYKNLGPWVDKAIQQTSRKTLSVLLLPSRTEQQWFRKVLIGATELSFFDARIQFNPPRGVPASSNREGSILAVFDPAATQRRVTVRDAKLGTIIYSWLKGEHS